MKKLTNRPFVALAVIAGSLVLLGPSPTARAAQNTLPAPHERADKAQFFSGKVEEVNLEAKWLKVDKHTYLVGDKTRLMNKDKEIKLNDLHVGTEVHGLAKDNSDGKLEAIIVKVGPKPNEAGHPDHQ